VRSETEIGRAAVSMASAAVQLATKIFGGLSGKCVLLVGAGEMGELAAKHLGDAGASRIQIANRTLARAEALAQQVKGEAVPFEKIHALLEKVDVVVCSTASPVPIFTRENVSPLLKARRHRPLFMVDLAVPRDIAAEVNSLEGVYAYDVDDIQRTVAENSAARLQEAAKAEVIIAEEIARFSRTRQVREGVPVLAQLRKRAEQIARAELERTFGSLGDSLTDKQKKSVEAMAMAIVNKLLHEPTNRLRTVTLDGDQRLAGAAAELFGLGDQPPPPRKTGS
jgi:glutamyl-tRNA reductase